MSAALIDAGPEPEPNDASVSEWIDRILSDVFTTDTHHPDDDPAVARICTAAVDPHEIAAALEASGMSHQVVVDTYGHRDVFELAEQLWTHIPFQPATPPTKPDERGGNWQDLARGALYAAPAFILFVLTRALHVELAWWALPLAMTWGWGLGQVTAFTGHTLRGRNNTTGEARTGALLITLGTLTTATAATIIGSIIGGGLATTIAAAGVTAYMVANAIMLLHNQERLAALLLTPAATATALALALGSNTLTDTIAIATIIPCAIATFIAAARHLHYKSDTGTGLAPTDLRAATAHLIHGIFCGLALSLVAIQGARLHTTQIRPEIIALPLLTTLGIMEWQLRTFKTRVNKLTRTTQTLHQFKPAALATFQRSFRLYTTAVTLVSAAVAYLHHHNHINPPYTILATQIILALAFYLDLTLTSLGRVDAVLRCWYIAAATATWYATWTAYTTNTPGDTLAWRSASIAALIAAITLHDTARQITPTAISY